MKPFKKIIFAALIIASSFNSFADSRDWAALGRYAEANAALPAPAPDEHRVVFMGNSITDSWIKMRPDFFADNNYIDRGISGQTSSQMLLRFREDVINLRPEVVVINAGTNDCAENTGPFNIDVTFGNIISMVQLAQANGIKVVMASTLPAAGFHWNPDIIDAPERIAALNSRIREYASMNGIPYVDYYSAMVTGPDRALNPDFTLDGVHPTPQGYAVMETIVKPVLDKATGR